MVFSIAKDTKHFKTRYYIYNHPKNWKKPFNIPKYLEGDGVYKRPITQAKAYLKAQGCTRLKVIYKGKIKIYFLKRLNFQY